MNALELAKAIQYCGDSSYNIDVSNMLRQQHAELEAHKEAEITYLCRIRELESILKIQGLIK